MKSTLSTSRPYPVWTAILLSSMVLIGCSKAPVETAQAPARDEGLVIANELLQSQIKIGEVSTTPIADTLRVAGRIDFDEQQLSRIGATVTGRITKLQAVLGQSVKKGEILAELHSSELSTAQLAYLKARSKMELTRRNVERAKSLFDADVISAAELQRRESEFQITSAETRAAADQLRVLGVQASAIERLGQSGLIDSNTPVVSSIHGVVVERRVAQGQVVEPTDTLFVVADLSQVWAVAQVPEQQVGQVKVGQSVEIEVAALDDEKIQGKLIYVGQIVNPETRTVLVRTELDNRDGRLKPAMLASMVIQGKTRPKLFVPASAVVRQNDEEFVFTVLSPDTFMLRKVKLAAQQDGKRVVLEGLQSGEKIVTEGAFHLNNERNRQVLQSGNNTGGQM